jgi:hypothetical protein
MKVRNCLFKRKPKELLEKIVIDVRFEVFMAVKIQVIFWVLRVKMETARSSETMVSFCNTINVTTQRTLT